MQVVCGQDGRGVRLGGWPVGVAALLLVAAAGGCQSSQPQRELGVRGHVVSLATNGPSLVGHFLDKRVYVWEWRNLDRQPAVFARGQALDAAVLAPGQLVTEWVDPRGARRTVLARELPAGPVARTWPVGENWFCSDFAGSLNGRHVAVLLEEQRPVRREAFVGLVDPATAQIDWLVTKGRIARVADETLAISNDGRYVAVLGLGRMHVLAVADMRQRQVTWQRQVTLARTMAFSPDGRVLYAGGYYGVHALQTDSGRAVAGWTAGGAGTFGAAVARVAASPDGRLLAVGTDAPDGRVYLLDARTGRLLDRWRPTSKETIIDGVAFSPDSRLLATADQHTQSIRIWRMEAQRG